MPPIIRVENLGKEFTIGHRDAPYATLRESLTKAARAPFSRARRAYLNARESLASFPLGGRGGGESPQSQAPISQSQGTSTTDRFWALHDVSFEVRPGEVIGIIGRNGAGKSTLLKILSRITEPTTGRVDLYGRVGSLLEVGTGFHPELTGRENIYLNGAILGMSRREIDRRFDEIVDFAEVDNFIDTPVKRYSSGMYLRLAFGVAAHLETEILVVDEVLAVGDVRFQRKCLGKIQDVANTGRTVLFVSHNMAAVRSLCCRGVLLCNGAITQSGEIDKVISDFLSATAVSRGYKGQWSYRQRGARISIRHVELHTSTGPSTSVCAGESCKLRVFYEARSATDVGSALSLSLSLLSGGERLANLWTSFFGATIDVQQSGIVDCHIPKWPFRSTSVSVDIYTQIGFEVQDWIEGCLLFDSFDDDYYGHGVVPDATQGILFLEHDWTCHANE